MCFANFNQWSAGRFLAQVLQVEMLKIHVNFVQREASPLCSGKRQTLHLGSNKRGRIQGELFFSTNRSVPIARTAERGGVDAGTEQALLCRLLAAQLHDELKWGKFIEKLGKLPLG